MAHPMRKHSQARKGKRRAHWNVTIPGTSQCTQCGQRILPHRACPHCGYYRGQPIVAIREKKKDKKA